MRGKGNTCLETWFMNAWNLALLFEFVVPLEDASPWARDWHAKALFIPTAARPNKLDRPDWKRFSKISYLHCGLVVRVLSL